MFIGYLYFSICKLPACFFCLFLNSGILYFVLFILKSSYFKVLLLCQTHSLKNIPICNLPLNFMTWLTYIFIFKAVTSLHISVFLSTGPIYLSVYLIWCLSILILEWILIWISFITLLNVINVFLCCIAIFSWHFPL